jgi:hypothetical protein
MTPNVVVYTAIFNHYDALTRAPDDGQLRVCFTDSPVPSRGWSVRVVGLEGSPRNVNRWYKMYPHVCLPEAEYSIYMDGNKQLMGSVDEILSYLGDNDIAMYRHPWHQDMFSEGERAIELGKVPRDPMVSCLDRYRDLGVPEDAGFYACNIIVRRHTDAMARLSDLWWDEYKHCPEWADQTAFAYARWATETPVSELPADLWPGRSSRLFSSRDHVPKLLDRFERSQAVRS